ncbi:hypothetical protein K7X08_011144 [Anisodus acutangulus]|uniref:Uncharacterized protein n=1 Tax=Anisodus acutangulus TaxID=402998 RepID=A0A9Q1LZF0_9SOLA|nr:hypothetical protein K7X08_011144 [Anisodus acutangulus]
MQKTILLEEMQIASCTGHLVGLLIGGNGITEVTVGVVTVFDGHNSAEATLSRKMIGLLPNERGQSTLRDLNWKLDELNFGRLKLTVSSIIDQSFHLEILREALLRAIDDIDSAFSRDAFRHNFDSGSTATVILMAENQILVANIGDSKAFLCSEESKSQEEAEANLLRLYRQTRGFGIFEPVKNFRSFKLAAPDQCPFLIAKELTRDHHPYRDDERAEQAYEYTPPEALLNASWYQGLTPTTMKYDMWSVGVVILELVLGTPDVFQVSSRTRALLDQHLEGWNESLKELAYKLRSFMEMCILSPGVTSKLHQIKSKYDQALGDCFNHKMTDAIDTEGCKTVAGIEAQNYDAILWASASPAPWKCSEDFFSRQIKNRDPLKIGFPNIWPLRLVHELLQWNPEDRPSVDEALKHPYFSQR